MSYEAWEGLWDPNGGMINYLIWIIQRDNSAGRVDTFVAKSIRKVACDCWSSSSNSNGNRSGNSGN